jgi:hypothetical protein
MGPKREEVAGGWRKLDNEEIHDLYCLPSGTSMNKTGRVGHVAHMGENRNAYYVLAVKTEGKRSLGISRRR